MQNAKKPWVAPKVRKVVLSESEIAQSFPQLTAEQRGRIAGSA